MRTRLLGHWLLFGSVGCVVFFVTIAVVMIDSPRTMRDLHIDERRLVHLDAIEKTLDCFWSYGEKTLPDDVSELKAWTQETQQLVGVSKSYCRLQQLSDPQTGDPYIYRVTSASEYELCAVFATENSGTRRAKSGYGSYGARKLKSHKSGEHCFALTASTPLLLGKQG